VNKLLEFYLFTVNSKAGQCFQPWNKYFLRDKCLYKYRSILCIHTESFFFKCGFSPFFFQLLPQLHPFHSQGLTSGV